MFSVGVSLDNQAPHANTKSYEDWRTNTKSVSDKPVAQVDFGSRQFNAVEPRLTMDIPAETPGSPQ